MMKSNIRRTICLCIAVLMVGSGSPVHADDDRRDQELARRALREGAIRPLAEITTALSAQLPGDIIAVKLDREDGVYVYEFKVLTPGGILKEVEVDAKTAQILKIEDDD